jgi:hypothetical protein
MSTEPIKKNPFSLNDPEYLENISSMEKIDEDIRKIRKYLERKSKTLIDTLKLHMSSYEKNIKELKTKCTHTKEDGSIAIFSNSMKLFFNHESKLLKTFTCDICGKDSIIEKFDLNLKNDIVTNTFLIEKTPGSYQYVSDLNEEEEEEEEYEEIEFHPNFITEFINDTTYSLGDIMGDEEYEDEDELEYVNELII